MKKAVLLILGSLLIGVLITCGILFIPRPLENRFPNEEIVSIKYVDRLSGESDAIELSQEKYQEFMELVSEVRYRPRYLRVKCISSYYFIITYISGRTVNFSDASYSAKDQNGNVVKGTQIIVSKGDFQAMKNLFT